jgi:hypothetical protein
MKRIVIITACFSCFILHGCITEYNAKGINELRDILVVDGLISEGESYVTLSRSEYLTDTRSYFSYIYDANVFVECDDGTQMIAEKPVVGSNPGYNNIPRYIIQTGKLHHDRKYRLRIELEEYDMQSEDCFIQNGIVTQCPTKSFEYCSNYSYPIVTPEIDSVFWTKNGEGELVKIHVATHDPDQRVIDYRRTFKEQWEIHSDYMEADPSFPFPYYCWNHFNNTDILLSSGENTIFGTVTDIITELEQNNRKLEVLYKIDVKQNAITKRAFDYFTNIRKNTQQSNNIFASVPSELRGNIVCTNEPDRPVIGYVDVSITTQKQLIIRRIDGVYEFARRGWNCELVAESELLEEYEGIIPDIYKPYLFRREGPDTFVLYYILTYCVDCTHFGYTQKPDDWP